MSRVVVCHGLVKSFGSFRALDELELEVNEGEVHGFLGPNGSGKSVTLRILLGVLRATGGTVEVFGADPWADAVALHRRLTYVPGDTSLWPNLTGGEIIDVLGALGGGLDDVRRGELIERFELDPTKKARTYSKGNRQKVALVAALASTAELFILDEPTSGLDPLMESVFQECVREIRERGGTVLLSSHILAEVEKLCDRLTIIRSGRTVESGTLKDLRLLDRLTLSVETAQSPVGLADLDGVHDLVADGGQWVLRVDQGALDSVVRALAPLGVRRLESRPATLEELFLRHYQGETAP